VGLFKLICYTNWIKFKCTWQKSQLNPWFRKSQWMCNCHIFFGVRLAVLCGTMGVPSDDFWRCVRRNVENSKNYNTWCSMLYGRLWWVIIGHGGWMTMKCKIGLWASVISCYLMCLWIPSTIAILVDTSQKPWYDACNVNLLYWCDVKDKIWWYNIMDTLAPVSMIIGALSILTGVRFPCCAVLKATNWKKLNLIVKGWCSN
jgi:hypothetical protein